VLHEEEGGFPCLDVEILLHLGTLLATKGWVGEDDVVAIFLLNVADAFFKGVEIACGLIHALMQ